MSTLHSLKWVRIPLDFCHFPSLLRRLPNDCHPGKYLDVCTLHSSDRFRMLHIMIAEMQKPLFNNCYDFGCECKKIEILSPLGGIIVYSGYRSEVPNVPKLSVWIELLITICYESVDEAVPHTVCFSKKFELENVSG